LLRGSREQRQGWSPADGPQWFARETPRTGRLSLVWPALILVAANLE